MKNFSDLEKCLFSIPHKRKKDFVTEFYNFCLDKTFSFKDVV